jgi:hypothetical protein
MSGLFGSAPEPPSPIATSGAQTASNVSTAIANAFLQNTNQVTPQGTLTYNQTGTHAVTDPLTGTQYDIPQFTSTQALTPQGQAIQSQTDAAKLNLAGLANTQSSRLASLLGSNIDLSQAPAMGDASKIAGPSINNTDYNQARSHVEDALFQRLNPQLERSRGGIEQRLADQGIRYGSDAYRNAMGDYSREANDLRLDVIAKGAAEQQQAFAQDLARGQFGLAQQQALFNAQNLGRSQYLTEQYAMRNQPINEVTALLSGSQVSRPQFLPSSGNQIANTDVAGIIGNQYNQQLAASNANNKSTNDIIGGLFGLTGSALISDKRAKKDIHRIGAVFAAEPQSVEEPANASQNKKLPIYQYVYKNDPTSTRHVGPMAQDVEKIDPDAVKSIGGIKHINAPRVMGSILRAM